MNQKKGCGFFFLLVLALSIFTTSVLATPSVDILNPKADQENNRLVIVEVNASDTNLNTVWYNWNGTNYTITNNKPTVVEMAFGKQTLKVWANDTTNNITSASRTFNIGLNVENGKAILFGLVSVMFLFFALGLFFSDGNVFVRNGFMMLGLFSALITATVSRRLLTYQYADVDLTGVLVSINNIFTILVWVAILWNTFYLLLKLLEWLKSFSNKKAGRSA